MDPKRPELTPDSVARIKNSDWRNVVKDVLDIDHLSNAKPRTAQSQSQLDKAIANLHHDMNQLMTSPLTFPTVRVQPWNPLDLDGKTVTAPRALWKAINEYEKEPTQENDQKLDSAMRRALVCFDPERTFPEDKNVHEPKPSKSGRLATMAKRQYVEEEVEDEMAETVGGLGEDDDDDEEEEEDE